MHLFRHLFRAPLPEPQVSAVDAHFDSLGAVLRPPGMTTVEREAAQALADRRGNPRPVTRREVAGLFRVQLRDREGHMTGWLRASPSQADQARAAGLPTRPEADFPLPDIEPAQDDPKLRFEVALADAFERAEDRGGR